MKIQCTKKLLDKLDVEVVAGQEEDPLFSWHANLITFNRKNVVILVNDKNRFSVILHGLKATTSLRLRGFGRRSGLRG
nr:hypothetical protein [Bacillus sp. FJAT-27225]